ncbi:MAG: hypothetical protein HON90_16295 [Halobacteriovoraceae bacterium]|jgi:ABC-2 type transport system permease protein|nr:hypothetical protein [Halobacteriovoraceae bacterium]
MIRYARLYLHFLRFAFSKAMEFRADFFFRVVMDIIIYIVHFLFFSIIYLHTPILGGWSIDEMKIFIATFIFIDAFHMTFFANNTWWFPIYINRGDLDYYLTKPVSSFFFMAFKEFAANSLLNLILAIGLLSYMISNHPVALDLSKILVFILLIINGSFLFFMTYFIFLIPVFWTHSPRGFGDVFYSAEKIFQRPDGIFQGFAKKVFLYFLPFSMMASYPTRYLVSPTDNSLLLEILAASCFIYFVVYLLWKKGLRNYSSASS